MAKSRKVTAARKTRTPKSRPKPASRRSAATRFRPFYNYPAARSRAAPDSLSSQLSAAIRSPDAVAGLRRFLKNHASPDREYQDAFQGTRIRAAQFELMRLEYLSGNVNAGDRLLAQLQDLDG